MFINVATFQEKNKEEIEKPRFVRRKQEDKATNHDIFIDTQCLQKHQKKKFKASNIEPLYGTMMRGGAGGSSSEIINLAIRNAFRHMINLEGGTENPAEGNCAWESAIGNINERPEIEPKVNLDPGDAKIVYLNEMQEYTEGDGHELIPDHLKMTQEANSRDTVEDDEQGVHRPIKDGLVQDVREHLSEDEHGEAFVKIKERTSVFPFQAIWEGRQTLPDDYWKELVRAPIVLIAVGSIGAYFAHPYMQAGAALARNSGLSPGGILDPIFLELN